MYYEVIEEKNNNYSYKSKIKKLSFIKNTYDFLNCNIYIRKVFTEKGKLIYCKWKLFKNKSQNYWQAKNIDINKERELSCIN